MGKPRACQGKLFWEACVYLPTHVSENVKRRHLLCKTVFDIWMKSCKSSRILAIAWIKKKTYHWLNCLALKSYPTSDPSGIFWGMVNPSPLIIHLPMNPMSKNPILNQRFWDVFLLYDMEKVYSKPNWPEVSIWTRPWRYHETAKHTLDMIR